MLTANRKYEFQPNYAIAPGETLKEVMASLNMSQKELAVRTDITTQSLHRISKSEQPISYETANKLELATGVPASLWNNLETQYRQRLAVIKERTALEADLDWLKSIPISELIHRGAIKPVKNKVVQLKEVLRFFGVSSVTAWQNVWTAPAVAARRSQCFETCHGPASAWIRLGEIETQKIECQPFNKTKFSQSLQIIRKLTVERPEVFLPQMVRACSDGGVALALVPGIKKVPWFGATKWISPSKAMILLSMRGKAEDQFWFSFFHEAGHVINDSKKDFCINDGKSKDPEEINANRFAAEILIPAIHDDQILKFRSKAEVIRLAQDLQISPGIVVGRFQHLTKKWKLFNELKSEFAWPAALKTGALKESHNENRLRQNIKSRRVPGA